jgi:hypothetical protein
MVLLSRLIIAAATAALAPDASAPDQWFDAVFGHR